MKFVPYLDYVFQRGPILVLLYDISKHFNRIFEQNLLQELKMLKNKVEQLEQEKSEYKLKLKVTQV